MHDCYQYTVEVSNTKVYGRISEDPCIWYTTIHTAKHTITNPTAR